MSLSTIESTTLRTERVPEKDDENETTTQAPTDNVPSSIPLMPRKTSTGTGKILPTNEAEDKGAGDYYDGPEDGISDDYQGVYFNLFIIFLLTKYYTISKYSQFSSLTLILQKNWIIFK